MRRGYHFPGPRLYLPPAVKAPVLAATADQALRGDEFAVAFATRAKAARERIQTGGQRRYAPAANLARESRFESRASGLRARLAERKRAWRVDAM